MSNQVNQFDVIAKIRFDFRFSAIDYPGVQFNRQSIEQNYMPENKALLPFIRR